MQRLIARARKILADFIEQRDDVILLARCSETDWAILLKLLRDLEQADSSDVFLLFGDPFADPESFLALTVERLREEYQVASQALEEDGKSPLPPMPDFLTDKEKLPAERLRGAIAYCRSLLPKTGGNRLVWGMFPEKIEDHAAYLQMISALVPWKRLEPWMRGTRLVFRVSPGRAPFSNSTPPPRTHLEDFDFGQDAAAKSIQEDMEDETRPLEERMQALFSLAVLDYAHHRVDDAFEKFRVLLGHYQHTENDLMQAMVMNGIGDTHFHRTNNLERAQYWYECAVPPANAAAVPVVMASVVKNLGDVSFEMGNYAEAEQFYEQLDRLVTHMRDPEAKSQALEKQGVSQEKQKAFGKAVKSWEAGATLCRNIGLPKLLKPHLEHLARVYGRFEIKKKHAAVLRELKSLEQTGADG